MLYLHLDGGMTELGNALFAEMHMTYVGDNYWRKLGLSNWDSTRSSLIERCRTILFNNKRFYKD
ncbi:hypothetical protein OH492_07480 [Vibrio chagasii]|nr:hypothetical protein [Vibrio chagasii]